MENFTFDSFAMLAFFRGEEGGEEVERLLLLAKAESIKIMMTTYNAGEVFYIMFQKHNEQTADICIKELISLPIQIVEPEFRMTMVAAKIKATSQLSYADAHAAALALEVDGTLVTGDPEFRTSHVKGLKLKFIR